SRVTFLFQPPQHGAHGRLLELAGQPLADDLSGHRAMSPDQLHDLAFEVAELGQAIVHGRTSRFGLLVTLQIVTYSAALRNGVSSRQTSVPKITLRQRRRETARPVMNYAPAPRLPGLPIVPAMALHGASLVNGRRLIGDIGGTNARFAIAQGGKYDGLRHVEVDR